jgi:hypothetical protein
VTVISVAGQQSVFSAFGGRRDSGAHRFLPVIQVTKASDFLQAVHLPRFLFKASGQEHFLQDR